MVGYHGSQLANYYIPARGKFLVKLYLSLILPMIFVIVLQCALLRTQNFLKSYDFRNSVSAIKHIETFYVKINLFFPFIKMMLCFIYHQFKAYIFVFFLFLQPPKAKLFKHSFELQWAEFHSLWYAIFSLPLIDK